MFVVRFFAYVLLVIVSLIILFFSYFLHKNNGFTIVELGCVAFCFMHFTRSFVSKSFFLEVTDKLKFKSNKPMKIRR